MATLRSCAPRDLRAATTIVAAYPLVFGLFALSVLKSTSSARHVSVLISLLLSGATVIAAGRWLARLPSPPPAGVAMACAIFFVGAAACGAVLDVVGPVVVVLFSLPLAVGVLVAALSLRRLR